MNTSLIEVNLYIYTEEIVDLLFCYAKIGKIFYRCK